MVARHLRARRARRGAAEPQHFEQVAELVTADAVAEKVVCGPGTDPILERIGAFEEAGFDHVFLHQVGPRQEEFLEFAKDELLPAVANR